MQVSHSIASGRAALQTLIEAHPETTAVICTTDALALGALAGCRALGLQVPKHLSVTGYDDIDVSCAAEPPLTTVHVPAADIGRLAAEHLITSISGKHAVVPTELPTHLVLRGSCAGPR